MNNLSNKKDSGFMALFKFISGDNNQNKKIDMTVPVRIEINSKLPFTSEDYNKKMSF